MAKTGKKQAKSKVGRNGKLPPIEHRFKKGESGNPNGRKPKAQTIKDLRDLIQAYNSEQDKSKKTRLEKQIKKLERTERGIRLLWEYGYGKVPQKIEGGETPIPIQVVEITKQVEKPEDEE